MNDQEHAQLISDLQSSFYLFIRTFYPLLTARDFITPSPAGRESHIITIARELVKCAKLETNRLIITVPPGHGKSTLLSFWVAWCLAKYPDSRFIYISYAHTLAAKHTDVVRRIMMMKEYKDLFGVELRTDSKAKDYFQTTAGGAVAAFGSSGAVTGVDAGYPGLDRFSGAVIIDDPIKPNDAFSDVIREGIEQNYKDTIQQRARGPNVPFIFIGQRVHEADLGAYLLNGEDGYEWKKVVLKSLDEAGNALYPEAWPLDKLKILQQFHPYEFAAQHQQNPQPAGGSVFKEEWFVRLDFDPNITITFITADTAETDKSWNDATVFSFWGVYEIESMGRSTGEYGLHWIDCQELRIEPKDLKEAFLDFYGDCMRYKIPPLMAAIEKKSTGVTLTSVLSELRGLQVRSIERSRASGSKTSRFLAAQPYVASKRISFTDGARHVDMCINHMGRITTNDSHKNDDICDTLADAVRIALIDKTLLHANSAKTDYNALAQTSTQLYNKLDKLRQAAYRQ